MCEAITVPIRQFIIMTDTCRAHMTGRLTHKHKKETSHVNMPCVFRKLPLSPLGVVLVWWRSGGELHTWAGHVSSGSSHYHLSMLFWSGGGLAENFTHGQVMCLQEAPIITSRCYFGLVEVWRRTSHMGRSCVFRKLPLVARSVLMSLAEMINVIAAM